MNANYMLRIIIIVGLTFIMSCGNGGKQSDSQTEESPRIKKFSKIVSPKINATYHLGETIPFEIDSEKKIDSVKLEYNNRTQAYTSKTFNWESARAMTGNQRIRLTVYSEGNSETHFAKVKLLSDKTPEAYSYERLGVLPHDKEAYTQGLFFIGDTLIESTGLKGHSKLSKLNLISAHAYASVSIDNEYFGEGSTIWNNRIVMLTWTSGTGFVFDRNLKETETFSYTHQGWGITTYGDTLLISDGTEVIHKVDPRDFSEFGKLQVYDDKDKIIDLNELEMIDGLLYANVYQQDIIVAIDPATGSVLRKIDMSGLADGFNQDEIDVLNGIAYHPSTHQIYVTGKLWPQLFQVNFVPKN